MQAFDSQNARFMEYVAQHGCYFDVPAKFLRAEMARLYPHLTEAESPFGASMEDEASVA
jgi:hypothetical protein